MLWECWRLFSSRSTQNFECKSHFHPGCVELALPHLSGMVASCLKWCNSSHVNDRIGKWSFSTVHAFLTNCEKMAVHVQYIKFNALATIFFAAHVTRPLNFRISLVHLHPDKTSIFSWRWLWRNHCLERRMCSLHFPHLIITGTIRNFYSTLECTKKLISGVFDAWLGISNVKDVCSISCWFMALLIASFSIPFNIGSHCWFKESNLWWERLHPYIR